MKKDLIELLSAIDQDQLDKPIAEIEFSDKIENILQKIDSSKVVITGKGNNILIGGLGQLNSIEGEQHLFYRTKQNKLIVKIELIKDYLSSQ